MPRDVQPIAIDEHGYETHPAFGMAAVHKTSASHGAVLFDSEIQHRHYVTLTITRADRKRDLGHDWIHPGKELIEITMSEAQWAALVSSTNTSGVPVTISAIDNKSLPDLPYESRLQQSFDYAHEAADKMFENVKEKLAAVEEKPTKANIRALRIAVENSSHDVDYATKTVSEHVENAVTKARADIETMVARHAEHLELEPGAYTAPLALTVAVGAQAQEDAEAISDLIEATPAEGSDDYA
jgi:hypothetical protein